MLTRPRDTPSPHPFMQSNRLTLLKRLLDKFPAFRSTVNTPDLQGRTPLIWAGIKVGVCHPPCGTLVTDLGK